MGRIAVETAKDERPLQQADFVALRKQSLAAVDRFWRSEDALLTAWESFAKKWFARRHEAAHSALAASREAIACGTPIGALQCWWEWAEGSMERMSADFSDLRSEVAEIFDAARLGIAQDGTDVVEGKGEGQVRTAKSARAPNGERGRNAGRAMAAAIRAPRKAPRIDKGKRACSRY